MKLLTLIALIAFTAACSKDQKPKSDAFQPNPQQAEQVIEEDQQDTTDIYAIPLDTSPEEEKLEEKELQQEEQSQPK